MQCRNCGNNMEREDYMAVRGEGAALDYDLQNRCPSAWYYCPECGFEAQWRKGQPLEIIHNPYGREEVGG